VKLHKYNSYEEYKRIQEAANIKKIDYVWATEDNIKLLSDYLMVHIADIKFGICHGSRTGKEQEWFRKHLGVEVIGTEISKTAIQFPNTIQWDFHDVKQEWVNNVDFIYSNSFDHSYKPIECLDAWVSCIKKTGVYILEWTIGHIKAKLTDPFGATEAEYEEMIVKKYKLQDKLASSSHGGIVYFIVSH